jgi:DNA repair photolyase
MDDGASASLPLPDAPNAPKTGPPRGRGTARQPTNRFEPLRVDVEPDPEDPPRDPRTRYLRDAARSVISRNRSPDVPFEASLNPYRGCEHGCIYCYARPTHEYLGLSSGLDFETQIFVKPEAPALLRRELALPSWQPQVLALSGVTDPYQPIERRLELTRGCLQVLAEFRNPVGLITKSGLVARDTDVLQDLAGHRAASVTLSVTSLDPDLARRMEPRAAQPRARLRAIEALARAGIPVGVNVAPVIPGLTEHEIPAILSACADAGACWAGMLIVRLPHSVKDLFAGWLEDHYPQRSSKVLGRIREMRGGRLNDPRFGSRMAGSGVYYEQIRDVFRLARQRSGLSERGPELSAAAFRRPAQGQLRLF